VHRGRWAGNKKQDSYSIFFLPILQLVKSSSLFSEFYKIATLSSFLL